MKIVQIRSFLWSAFSCICTGYGDLRSRFSKTLFFMTNFQSSYKLLLFDTLREKCPNTELFLVRIQSKYRKIRTRENSLFGHFSRSEGPFSSCYRFHAFSRKGSFSFVFQQCCKYSIVFIAIYKNSP